MAAAWFNRLADPKLARALSAGTEPAARVHPVVLEAMKEAGLELRNATPKHLTPELVAGARLLVTMGCGDACPHVPGLERDDWPLPDPKNRPLEEVRTLRDRIRERVENLLNARGWNVSDRIA